jgi:hypothetical protein
LVLAVVAALLGLYFVFVDNPRERARIEQQDREGRVLSLKEDEVAGLEIDAALEHLVLERGEAGVWRVTAPISAQADDGTVRRLLTQLATMSVVRTIEPVGDEASIGLSNPAVRVAVRRSDGGRAEVAFGEANPTGSGVYVRRDDGRVFVTAATAKSTFEVSLDELRRKEFVDFKAETVTEIAITNRKRSLRLRMDGGEWRIADPARTADPEKVASLLSRLRALRATGFVDDAGARDGLRLGAEPRIGIELTTTDKPVTIEFLGAGDGSLYARTGGETLYRVNERVVEEMPLDATALRDMRLVRAAFDDVQEVEVVRGDTAYRVSRREGGWEMDGRRVEAPAIEAIEAMVRSLTTLRGESIAAESVSAAPKSAFESAEARVTLRGGGDRTIAVVTIGGANPTGRYALSGSTGPVFVISSQIVEQIPQKTTLEATQQHPASG